MSLLQFLDIGLGEVSDKWIGSDTYWRFKALAGVKSVAAMAAQTMKLVFISCFFQSKSIY